MSIAKWAAIESYGTCECGAVTLNASDGKSYCVKRKNLKKFFPDLDLRKIKKVGSYCNCDHCVNHYGLDLCGCGSGEAPETCKNGLKECGNPMQEFGLYTHISGGFAWA